ncbi:hypothetical protein ACSVDE_14720 [Pseudalkalibacillus sp. Hm43]|uniref:hypothetical protein n=1 Tax=Pseudalkalibacillus sp. Hm43 TaxID=3450742 RepID=UPI003F41D28D
MGWFLVYFIMGCFIILSLMSIGWFIYAYRIKSWKFMIVSLLFYLPMSIALMKIPLESALYLLALWNLVVIIFCLRFSFQKKSTARIFVSFILLISFFAAFIPIFHETIQHEIIVRKMDTTEIPVPVVKINDEASLIGKVERMCWGIDCMEGHPGPYVLPIDPIGIAEFDIQGKAHIEINLNQTERDYKSIRYMYIENDEIHDKTIQRSSFTLPSTIPEQVVKVTVEMKDTQKFTFAFGIRNGNRP